jgi:tetratricopeptide (TPR) repeat protein
MELYRNEEFAGALVKYTEASNSGGADAAAAYAWLVRTELHLKQPEEAEAAAKKALELNNDLPTAQSAMGEVDYRQGKLMQAQDPFRKIMLAKLAEPRAHLGLARLY